MPWLTRKGKWNPTVSVGHFGETEPVAMFTPDFDIDPQITDATDYLAKLEGEVLGMGDTGDVDLFRKSQADGLAIFVERRKKYGSHVENAKRFPLEHPSVMYVKCTRIIRMHERGEELDDDTLLDLANYCHIILSARTV